jgi:hypothetical protein
VWGTVQQAEALQEPEEALKSLSQSPGKHRAVSVAAVGRVDAKDGEQAAVSGRLDAVWASIVDTAAASSDPAHRNDHNNSVHSSAPHGGDTAEKLTASLAALRQRPQTTAGSALDQGAGAVLRQSVGPCCCGKPGC